MELLRIGILVTDKVQILVKKMEIEKKTKRQYVLKSGDYVNESKILDLKSIYRNTISSANGFISYECYCLPEDETKAKEMLLKKARNRILELSTGSSRLMFAIAEFNGVKF